MSDLNDEEGLTELSIPRLWRFYSPWKIYLVVTPLYNLQYLKTKEHMLGSLMARVRFRVTNSEPDRRQELNELFTNLQVMRAEVHSEIDTALRHITALSASDASVGMTEVGQPSIDNPTYAPNPDDWRYQGVPMFPGLGDRLP